MYSTIDESECLSDRDAAPIPVEESGCGAPSERLGVAGSDPHDVPRNGTRSRTRLRKAQHMQPIPSTPKAAATARPRHRTGARRFAVIGLTALVMTVLAACEPVWPVRVANQTAADNAAAWMATDYQTNGTSYSAANDADLILALTAIDANRTVAQQALGDLAAKAASYVNPGGVVNPGATAKVMLAVAAVRADPSNFGGLDLESLLRGSMQTAGTDTGRFGSSTPFAQSLAILALRPTSAGAPAQAVSWLASKQCPSGGFSYGNCNSVDADHTGLAVTALAAGGNVDAVLAGRTWLEANQNADGGYGTGGISNANSTGLATQALRTLGDTTRADNAAAYVSSIQYAGTAGTKAGAIPWKAGSDGNLLMATTQGVLAWGAGPMSDIRAAKVIGTACPGTTGVTEVVDLTRFDNTIRIACATGSQATGWTALANAGFTIGSVPGYEGAAICTINSYPKAGYPACWNDGFWSYWISEDNSGAWSFSDFGAAGRTPPLGSVEGWRYEPDWMHHNASSPGIPAPVH